MTTPFLPIPGWFSFENQGGNIASAEGGHHVTWNEDEDEEIRLEIFSPPYLFRGARPVVTAAPLEWKYGQTLAVQTPNAAAIAFVSLVRNCVTTHSYDSNQRLVDLPIAARHPQALELTLTTNPNLAPPRATTCCSWSTTTASPRSRIGFTSPEPGLAEVRYG